MSKKRQPVDLWCLTLLSIILTTSYKICEDKIKKGFLNFDFRFDFQLTNCIGDIKVSMLASSAVDRGFGPRSGKTKDYKIGICCFSAKHAALRSKSKDWLA